MAKEHLIIIWQNNDILNICSNLYIKKHYILPSGYHRKNYNLRSKPMQLMASTYLAAIPYMYFMLKQKFSAIYYLNIYPKSKHTDKLYIS